VLPASVTRVAPSFFNIRGSFKIAGLLDVKTQASLVRLGSGDYVLLDSCDLDEPTARFIEEETSGGDKLKAIIHVHPFHTVYARRVHERFPGATLFGTRRHQHEQGQLPWADEATETEAFQRHYADDFGFSVPGGVHFIPDDEKLHFASVLVFHPNSQTLHVDDTLNFARLPGPVKWFIPEITRFHPTLSKVLREEKGAVQSYRAWAEQLIERCRPIRNLCTAHTHHLLDVDVEREVRRAYDKTRSVLDRHEAKHG